MHKIIQSFLANQTSIDLAKKVVAHAQKHPMTECVYAYEIRTAKTLIARQG